ncbi:MAG: prepilin-type N-terminal cleavage/methylation domain-containing protein [Bacilli bacterium]
MNSKKGFTLLELLVSMALLSLILIFLLNMLIKLKDVNIVNKTSLDFSVSQALNSKEINGDIYKNKGIKSVLTTNKYLLEFTLGDESKRKLIIEDGAIKYYKFIKELERYELIYSDKPINDQYNSISYTHDGRLNLYKIILELNNNKKFNTEIYYSE